MVGEEFPELPWLKAKGYYVIEEFVANWVEIALRMSWAAAGGGGGGGGGGRKAVRVGKGVKEKAGLAANAFWREKGYVDWWMRLEPRVRARIMGAFFGKGTTALANEIIEGTYIASSEKFSFCLGEPESFVAETYYESTRQSFFRRNRPCCLDVPSTLSCKKNPIFVKELQRLMLVQEIVYLKSNISNRSGDAIFFTKLMSAGTVADHILMKLRGILMVVSTESINLELIGDEAPKAAKKKDVEKISGGSRKGKKKSSSLKKLITSSKQMKSKSCIPKAVNCCDSSIALNGTDVKGIGNTKLEDTLHSPRVSSLLTTECSQSVKTSDGFSMNEQVISQNGQNESTLQPSSCLPSRSDTVDRNSVVATEKILPPVIPTNMFHSAISDNGGVMKTGGEYYVYNRNTLGGTSYEWPSVAPHHFVSPEMQQRPATTDRLHLDVGYRWPAQFEQPFLPPNHQMRNPPVEAGCNQVLSSLSVPLSFDWPPVFRGYGKLNQNNALGYDPLYTPQMQSSAWSGFHAPLIQRGSICNEKDRKYFGDSDPRNKSDVGDDTESYWFSEEESDGRGLSGRDINQYFGGGVMYWSPAEHAGTGFSRPPSLSSDDSAWAWHEADVSQVLDDIPVGIPCTYNANSVSSPPSTSVCSQNESPDPLPQSVGHSMTANGMNSESLQSPSSMQDSPEDKTISVSKSVSCGSEVIKGDTLPYAMLRPIVVPISRRPSRSEFKGGHDHRSPCVPSNRRDIPLVRRPPSPVVLSVPRVPRPPPPSPVGESRKRGFPIVRSGSSSPRHWGMRSLFTEDKILNRAQFCLDGPEVVWPSWGNKGSPAGTLGQSIEDTVLQDHLVKISQLSRDQHPDVALPLQPPDMLNCSSSKASLSLMHNALHEEIDQFCKQVSAENLVRKPYINWAVKRVTRCLQVLWPRSRTNLFGSNATGLALPTSDVDLVISLPPVRNLEPIKEAGILEGRNGIKETCLQHAARCLANQDWVRTDSLKTVENTAIPVIMLVAQVPCDTNLSSEYSSVLDSSHEQLSINVLGDQGSPSRSDNSSSEGSSMPMCSRINKDDGNVVQSIRLDISFKSPSHTGLQTTELVCELTQQFPAAVPLALILKKFLADRSLDHPYSGGLSSYCLVLLIVRFLQHEHHLGRPINQNLGSLLMDFLYFFGNVFDPRHMRISIQGSGIYLNRERGHSIDPIHIDDPLCPANNVGRNCFRIHQCIKAFADAFTVLENELLQFSAECYTPVSSFNLLKKIMPSIDFDEL
ncbi:hypothetical protein OsI_24054 [Oryza sativa Indica Group]|uniref:Polymerase nucleotidyl transferase domain-containing protein n=1 Tax=Oryza sativa subsp. indica TaxID=39946 RepID=B8B166_ORYSI|nr:hypothetical protein OsI_24054 [Oryza sativa Indica Group]